MPTPQQKLEQQLQQLEQLQNNFGLTTAQQQQLQQLQNNFRLTPAQQQQQRNQQIFDMSRSVFAFVFNLILFFFHQVCRWR